MSAADIHARNSILAGDPKASVWVAASAGTGKTTVLTNRVLALLLAGTAPERILCLTFTKAAAANMANRVNRLLGEWATIPDPALAERLARLTGSAAQGDALERARRLFARVVEAPGGLKIETVHAFAESLLRRFPLEAGLAPHFQVMDERSARELMELALNEVLAGAERPGNAALAAALGEVTARTGEEAFHELMAELAKARGRVMALIDRPRGLARAEDELRELLGVERGADPETILGAACADDAFDPVSLKRAAAALLEASKSDRKLGQLIADWLAEPARRVETWERYVGAYLTDKGERRARLATKDAINAMPGILEILGAEADRVLATIERVKAATLVLTSRSLLALGGAVLAAYRAHKVRRALVDFDDLILETRRLLARRGADWVLYKLDRGLDHILIDEAQDTSPDQWRIVATLAEEFFAGSGAREETRTLFAVGDAKQSIFSFQGADREAFDAMGVQFAARVRAAGEIWRPIPLSLSFRSSPAILEAVDAVFARAEAADGVAASGETIHHDARRQGQAGLVELWPAVAPRGKEALEPWALPVERGTRDDPRARLAGLIAARIARWIETKEPLESQARPIRAGDVMILVRRRGAFLSELVRALKSRGVPVAGVDRMVLTHEIAVMDLMALALFLLMPEDDLSLASALKSPLFGWDEEALFDLAYGRANLSLWAELQRRAGERADWTATRDRLAALLARVDYVRPYELFAQLLDARAAPGSPSGRERMLARLGTEAAEPMDEFLALALQYERGHVPSLEGFLRWVAEGEGEIKRDAEATARDEVRILTVHGAKGLEAPIVFLPDTLATPSQATRNRERLLWPRTGDGPFLWPPLKADEERVATERRAEAAAARDREYRRLLYVAMTRARDRLYVCGWETGRPRGEGCWYDLVAAGLGDLAQQGKAEKIELDFAPELAGGWNGAGYRLVRSQTAAPDGKSDTEASASVASALPDWAKRAAPAEPKPTRPLAPSRPEEDEPAPRSPTSDDGTKRFLRGLLIHRLLEALPDLAPAARAAAARRYLARASLGLDAAMQTALVEETLAVLAHPDYAPLFGPGSRAEVPLTGNVEGRAGPVSIAGQVDRLVATPRAVLVVDYKTNRPPPARADEVAPLYLKQMAAYRALLREVYPGRDVRCALLWTDGPALMALDAALLDRFAP
ncbi:MAG TPA: double-strand break repair helicase AddA [Alphaproteobacteria bacterium]|nr:double-strand break repair helicase AddA [Alphaproteobacteria bacterium]